MSPHTTRAPGDRRCRHAFPAGLTARFAGRRPQPGRRRRPCAAGSVGPLDGSAESRLTLSGRRACPIYGMAPGPVPAPLSFTAGERQNRLVAAALDERAELIASPATNSAPADGPGAPACLALADTAPCPVLAVPLTGRWRPTAGGSTICGIDGSDWSATAARTAARLAMALGTRLELVHVVTPPKNRADHDGDPRGAFRDFLWRALCTLDAMPPVDLVLDVGDPARRLRTFAESDPRCS